MVTEPGQAVHHLLMVPVDGYFDLYHSESVPSDDRVKFHLWVRNGKADDPQHPARIEAKIEGRQCVVWFIPDAALPLNQRAREMVADLFGWHMLFYGAVAVGDLDAEAMTDLIKRYG